MITNWVVPKTGATMHELFATFRQWPKYAPEEYRFSARTNLAITKTGVIEDYDYQRLHSENLEVEP